MAGTLALTTRFPRSHFYPDWNLMTWHPVGVLDEKTSDRVMDFLEVAEKVQGAPFDRYADLTGFTKVQVGLNYVVRLARRRRLYKGPPVKTALHASNFVGLTVAHMYAELMQGSRIQVCTFRARGTAAEWLGVPRNILLPPPERDSWS